MINIVIAGGTLQSVDKYSFVKKASFDNPPDEFTFELATGKTYQSKYGRKIQVLVKVTSNEQLKETLYQDKRTRLRGVFDSKTNAFLPYDIVKLPDNPSDKGSEILIYKWAD